MFFSIIVPVYNTEKYLDKCITSILEQTFSDYEIIIVDDGSKMECAIKIDSYLQTSSRIRVIHQVNKGLGGARNTGIQAAKGDYLFFLDSDDYIDKKALEIASNYLVKNQLDILAYDLKLVRENGDYLDIATNNQFELEYNEINKKEMIMFQPTACSKIYKTQLFHDYSISFPEKLWYEDLATIYRIIPHGSRFGYLKYPLYNYVQQNDSITHSTNLTRMMEIMTSMNIVVDYFKANYYYKDFQEELEWIAFLHVLYYSMFRISNVGYRPKKIHILETYMQEKFPNYSKNKYIIKNLNSYYLMKEVYKKKYFVFYVKNTFLPIYIYPLKSKFINIFDCK